METDTDDRTDNHFQPGLISTISFGDFNADDGDRSSSPSSRSGNHRDVVDGPGTVAATGTARLVTPSHHINFLAFLSLCQRFEVNFLPITWQQAHLAGSHPGANSVVSELQINLNSYYAFKRVAVGPDRHPDRSERRMELRLIEHLEALKRELVILSHPSVRQHKNIVDLAGVCWEIEKLDDRRSPDEDEDREIRDTGRDGSSDDHGQGDAEQDHERGWFEPKPASSFRCWPVLVFEKARHVDLMRFMETGSGRDLDFHSRLAICGDIVTAVADLHLNWIVHGDIKPQNVLVYPSSSSSTATTTTTTTPPTDEEDTRTHDDANSLNKEGITAKLSDFGHSYYFLEGDEFARVATTQGWSAPEWRRDAAFDRRSSQRLDVFSVSLLCMWLLFYVPGATSAYDVMRRQNPPDGSESLFRGAVGMIADSEFLDDTQKHRLCCFFRLGLEPDAKKRVMDANALLQFIVPQSTAVNRPEPLPAQDLGKLLDTCRLEIDAAMPQMYMTDFRVRKFIAQSLRKTLKFYQQEDRDAFTRANNLVLEWIFCQLVGFGTARDLTAVAILMRQHEQPELMQRHLNYKLKCIREHNQPAKFTSHLYRQVLQEGYDIDISVEHTYAFDGVLEEAIIWYAREKTDLEDLLGQMHQLPLLVMGKLSHLLLRAGQTKDAVTIRKELVDKFRRIGGDESMDTLLSLTHLAAWYTDEGYYAEAEEILRDVLEVQKRINNTPGGRPEVLEVIKCLASVYRHQGRLDEAEQLLKPAIEIRCTILGPDHSYTMDLESVLVSVYIDQKKYDIAESILLRHKPLLMSRHGLIHVKTLSCLDRLGAVYFYTGRLQDAEEKWNQVRATQDRIRNEESNASLNVLKSLANVRLQLNDYSGAFDLQNRCLEIQRRRLGPDNPLTLSTAGTLVEILTAQKRLTEAKELGLKTLQAKKRVYGGAHRSTLRSVSDLALVFEDLGELSEAKSIYVSGLAAVQYTGDFETDEARHILIRLHAILDHEEKVKEELGSEAQGI